jgi:hypothetical protein
MTRRSEEARNEAQQSLTILDKSLGPDHRLTKRSAGELAYALDALGRASESAGIRGRYGLDHTKEGSG